MKDRNERLEAALRENLKRRKRQERDRAKPRATEPSHPLEPEGKRD